GSPSDALDGLALPAPAVGGLVLGLPAGSPRQPSQDALGQAATGLAVGTRVGGAGRQAAGGAPGQDAGDGGPAGVVGVEDVGQEEPEGDQRRAEAVAAANLLGAAGLLDLRCGEQVGQGECRGVGALLPELPDLAAAAPGGSMSQGWPPCW